MKKDILPRDIGIIQNTRKALLITEQLTRSNQELLYRARSLRESNNFKFVWSNNGQILARRRHRSKVIRILDIEHVERLKQDLNTDLSINQNGQHNSPAPIRNDASQP